MKYLIFIILTIFLLSETFAQNSREFGTISRAEFQMKNYAKDTTAKAVILYDFGETIFSTSGIYYYQHRIVKIFEDDAFDLADVIIPYPQGSSLRKLDAVTYNIENGELIQSSISKKNVHKTLEIDGVNTKKFAMPDVRPGSIIEYEYSAQLGSYLFLNSWEFQSRYPTKLSEYRVKLPAGIEYKVLTKGHDPVSNIEDKKYDYHFIARDVPAFEEEPYSSAAKNFITSVSFELQSSSFGSFYSTYERISETLLLNDFFGGKLDNTSFLKPELELIKSKYDDKYNQAKGIYNYVLKNTNFNDQHDLFSITNFKQVIAGEEASSADINLLLTSLYRTAGLEAVPVILSTRNNGRLHPSYPIINQYNHVICRVDAGDRFILVDATDKYLPFEELPVKDLNGKGRLIAEHNFGWIELKGKENRNTSIKGDFILDDDGTLEGTLQHEMFGYSAADLRKELDNNGKDQMINRIEETNGWEIFDIIFEAEEDYYKPLIRKIDMAITDKTEVVDNKIYLAPILSDQVIDNPFIMEKRKYPIDYICSQEKLMRYNIVIPEGYSVEYLPEKLLIELPNNAGLYAYSVVLSKNTIKVEVQFKIDQVLFDTEDYEELKQFYKKIISTQGKNILLKKVS